MWTRIRGLLIDAGLVIIILVEAIFLSIIFASKAGADPVMKVVCDKHISNDRVRCEVYGLIEWNPHWEVTLNNRLAQHEVNKVVYLTLDEQWRKCIIYILTRNGKLVLWDGYLRWNGKEVEFGHAKEKT